MNNQEQVNKEIQIEIEPQIVTEQTVIRIHSSKKAEKKWGMKSYFAKILGKDEKFGLKREFIQTKRERTGNNTISRELHADEVNENDIIECQYVIWSGGCSGTWNDFRKIREYYKRIDGQFLKLTELELK